MKSERSSGTLMWYLKEHVHPFLRENRKIIAQSTFTLLFIAIGIWFVKNERAELVDVKNTLVTASWQWMITGLAITLLYIILQGLMYVFSFAAVKIKVSLFDSTILFLKRNFISIFLPAGGITSLAFFTGVIESKGITKTQIYFASSIHGFIGILTVVIIAIPAFIYGISDGAAASGEWYALGGVLLLLLALYYVYRSIMNQGPVYKLLLRIRPSAEVFLNDLKSNIIDRKNFFYSILTSMVIEITGIVHLYIAMIALNFHPSLFAAVMGYIISVIFLIISPFLRGLGAIEVGMVYVLIKFGFGNVEAIAITFLYRFFEFWTPLIAGVLSFLSKLNKLLMRVLPAIFLMALGIINIISVLTPSIAERLHRLKEFVPVEVIHASNYLVMAAGLFLLITAAFMLKGMRTAWWFAVVLSLLSFIGHITKAIDYEEASAALLVILVLAATRKEYYIKTNPKLRNVGIQTSVLFTAAILTYGIIGFYFLDKKHFNIDFSFFQSVRYTLQNYFLVGSSDLVPHDSFARNFLYSINISGFISIAFLIYTFVRSYKALRSVSDEDLKLACELVKSSGKSSMDYFKTYYDKMLFFSNNKKAFISYRVTGNSAVALENPVTENTEEFKNCVREFDSFCYENGLQCIFYRVPEESVGIYHELQKKDLLIGQEGVVNLSTFSMEGGDRKSLRRSVNKIKDEGYKSTIHFPPVKDGVLQKIKSVSDEWLRDTERSEIVFSQGLFLWDELKKQTIITVENSEEKIIAFLNIIPDYAKDEATYDLIRKSTDAPHGVLDFILIELFNYLKSLNFTYVNLGFAPMSGLDDRHTFPERTMKFAYDRIRVFSQYKGLREYKEKFDPVWYNRYLIYQHDYDLLKLPAVLTNVIKP
jgi:phosphatidylglycerol lysyltransferase